MIRLSGVVGHIVGMVPVVVGMVDLVVAVGIVLVGIVPVSVASGTANISGKLVLRYLGWPVGPGSIFDQQTVVVDVGTQLEYFWGKGNWKLRHC